MNLEVVTPPDVEPVTLQMVKNHCRVWADVSAEDDLLTLYMTSAREWLEGVSARAFLTQTLRESRRVSSDGTVRLLRAPVQSITSILDEDGNDLPAALRGVATLVGLSPGLDVVIEYVAGYGDDPEDAPAYVRHAILLLVAHAYEQKSPVLTGTIATELPFALQSLVGRMSWGGELCPT